MTLFTAKRDNFRNVEIESSIIDHRFVEYFAMGGSFWLAFERHITFLKPVT